MLALDYMKRTKKLTPEIHAKAETFIAGGCQHLLTFEVSGGGFSWFGQAPANRILTSYGLMEFAGMARVHPVDPRVIERTQQWLARGSSGPMEAEDPIPTSSTKGRPIGTTAMRYASLPASRGPSKTPDIRDRAVKQARQFVSTHWSGNQDACTLAVPANFASDYPRDRAFAHQVIQRLLDARTEKDDQAWWTTEETAVYGRGASRRPPDGPSKHC